MSPAAGSVADAPAIGSTPSPALAASLPCARPSRPADRIWLCCCVLVVECAAAVAAHARGRAPGRSCCFHRRFLPCAAPVAPGTTSSIAISTAQSSARFAPDPSGQVSVAQAALFLILQALVGFAVLIAFNGFTIALGIASLAIVVVYPFMKRITYWPQIVLGSLFPGRADGWAGRSAGSMVRAPALRRLDFLVIGYDTIYAHQDREDDADRYQIDRFIIRTAHQADAGAVLRRCRHSDWRIRL